MHLYKNMLVINLGGIGDVLLSIPALRALKAAYPMAAITLMVVPRVAEIAAAMKGIDEVVIFSTSFKGIIADLRILIALRRRNFDLAINMRTIVSASSGRKMKVIFDIIQPEVSAGRNTGGLGYFFDIKIPEALLGEKSEMEYDLDIARFLSTGVVDRRVDFVVDEKSSVKVKGLIEQEGMRPNDILIGIHPGGMPSRRWPIENYVQLIESLRWRVKCKFVITGDKEEAGLGRRLAEISPQDIKNFCGKTSVMELAALIRMCSLFIVGDTGPMHIAAALKRPLIALCGPGDMARFDPRNIFPGAVVFYEKTACAPCSKFRCNDQRCLKAITPRDVIDAALRKLGKTG